MQFPTVVNITIVIYCTHSVDTLNICIKKFDAYFLYVYCFLRCVLIRVWSAQMVHAREIQDESKKYAKIRN